MKAIVQDGYGSAEVLHFRDIAVPDIGDDDALAPERYWQIAVPSPRP